MGSKEIVLSSGIPKEYGASTRGKNGLYKTNTYQLSNRSLQPYKPVTYDKARSHEVRRYQLPDRDIHEVKTYKPRTYDHVYVMQSNKKHKKETAKTPPKEEPKSEPEEPPPDSPEPLPVAPVSPPPPYSAVESIKRTFQLTFRDPETGRTEKDHMVFE